MNKKYISLYLIIFSGLMIDELSAKTNDLLKPALNILEKCMNEEKDSSKVAKKFNKKIAKLLAKKNIHKLIKILSEAEKTGNIYLINAIAFAIAKKLPQEINGQQLALLKEQTSSFTYALILAHKEDRNGSINEINTTRGCNDNPISIAEYISLYDTPIVYLGNIGILLFNDKNISSLNGIQDISNDDIAFTLINDNCITGNNVDNQFPADPFQGIPNTRYLIADNNLIEALPANFLHTAPYMQEIYLGNNLLTTLPNGLFSNLDELGLLDLSYNMLTTVTTTDILNLSLLNILFLNNNSLVDIPADLIDGNSNLRYIYLNNNILNSWPSTALNNVTNSIYLDLSNNNLTEFEPEYITDGSEIILTGNNLTTSQQDFLVATFPEVYFAF